MTLLGQEFNGSEQLLSLCEIFVCKMYGKPGIMDVNELRYEIFRTTPAQSSERELS